MDIKKKCYQRSIQTLNIKLHHTLSCCLGGETCRQIGGQELPEVHELTQNKFLQETRLFQDTYSYMKQCF